MKLKIIILICLLNFLTACSNYFPDNDVPLNQWTDQDLLEKAKYDFDNKDYDASYRNLVILAKKNNKEALYALGYAYYNGLGVEKNNDTAQEYIRQSADQGYHPAIRALRQFQITNSTFVADAKSPSYISANSPESNNKITDNYKEYSKEDPKNNQLTQDQTNNAIDQLLEHSNNIKNTLNTIDNKTYDNIKNNNLAHGFGAFEKIQPVKSQITAQNKPKNTKITKNINPTKSFKIKPPVNHEFTQEIWPTEETDESPIEPSIAISKNIEKNSNWVKSQNPDHYTIQITASNSQEEIDKFINNNNLQNKVKTFSYLYNNQTWYGAGFGVYNKPSDAYQALLEDMPNEIKLKKPWVRQFKNIVPADVG